MAMLNYQRVIVWIFFAPLSDDPHCHQETIEFADERISLKDDLFKARCQVGGWKHKGLRVQNLPLRVLKSTGFQAGDPSNQLYPFIVGNLSGQIQAFSPRRRVHSLYHIGG